MATEKRYRCDNGNCRSKPTKGEFRSKVPLCPLCGTAADEPRFGHLIVRLVDIHFDPPSHIANYGMGHRACNPAVPIQAQANELGEPTLSGLFHAGTGDPRCVTCDACKETDVFKRVFDEWDDAPTSVLVRLQQFVRPAG